MVYAASTWCLEESVVTSRHTRSAHFVPCIRKVLVSCKHPIFDARKELNSGCYPIDYMRIVWCLIALLGLLLFSQVLLVLAEQNPSHELDHVEITSSGKIIYYKDGSKEAFFSFSENMRVSANAVIIPNAVVVLPLDWIGLLEGLSGLVAVLVTFGKALRGILGFLSRVKWWLKYRKPRTPSDTSKYSLL